MEIKKKEGKGEITVFLSLVMLLIFALIGTIIESARVNAAKGFAERALEMAMDSVFTQYGRTLYDDYHIFFLESPEGGEGKLLDSIKEYMEYTFKPNNKLTLPGTEYVMPNVDLWGITTKETQVLEQVYATDYNGAIYFNQAVEYMKYRTGTQQIEKLLEYMKVMNSTSKTSKVVEEKLKVEESLGELNGFMIQCIENTEGIDFGRNGIQYTNSGLLKTEKNFIKQFCPLHISSSNLGINHNLVFNSLQNQYINPINLLSEMEDNIQTVEEKEAEIILLEAQVKQLIEQSQTWKNEDIDKENINKELQNIKESISLKERDIQESITLIMENQKTLITVSEIIIQKIDEVLKILPNLEKKQKSIVSQVEKFETVLNGSKSEMIQEVYDGMQEDLGFMKQYAGKEGKGSQESMIFRIQKMKPIFETNRSILVACSTLSKIGIKEKGGDWSHLIQEIETQKKSFQQYQVKPLSFDYSSLKPKSEVPNPLHSFNKLLKNGTMELVIEDISSLSKKKITFPDNMYLLHGKQESLQSTKEQTDTEYEQVLEESHEQGYDQEITQSFDTYSNNSSLVQNLKEPGNQIGARLLWSEYIANHFKDYLNIGQEKIEKGTALDYEKEYIIAGEESDIENIQAVITKLLMVRTILNFLYILGDSKKKEIAYATAAALVGYTCLEPVVRLTQVLILLVWAFEEALVDTGAILSGKTIPFLKDQKSFLVRYEELFMMNKVFIQSKIKQIPEYGKAKLFLGYKEYLKLFLMMTGKEKQTYRVMDLVQENMRVRYRSDFDISNCIYGIRIKSEWKIPSKFIQLGFVKRVLKKQKDGWIIQRTKDYSY